MKRSLTLAILVIIALLIGAVPVLAFDGPAVADVWVDGAGNYNNANPLRLLSSNPGPGCIAHSGTAYLQWDISSIVTEPVADKTIATAMLTLTTGASSSVPVASTITLYAVRNDAWTEAGGVPPPALEEPLASINIPAGGLAPGTPITFPNEPALLSYLNEQSAANTPPGDGIVSFALQFSVCGPVALQDFEDRSTATPPFLSLANANAITLRTFRAAGPTLSPLIWLAPALLLALLVAGVFLYRRRLSA